MYPTSHVRNAPGVPLRGLLLADVSRRVSEQAGAPSARRLSKADMAVVGSLSGTEPNNDQGHRQAQTQGTSNHQRKGRKQVGLGLHLMPAHLVSSIEPRPKG